MIKLKYLILILAGLTAGLVITEVSLRFHQYIGENQLFGLTPTRTTITWKDNLIEKAGWFVTPSGEYFTWVEPNQEGFFDNEHKIIKSENVYRIILLGDSFVVSLQTPKDETIGKLLEKKLNSLSLPKKIEVISIGLGDTGTTQQYIALKQFAFKYSPDLVVHLFLSANDIKNNSEALQKDPFRPYFKLDEGKLTFIPAQKKEESFIKKTFKKLRIVELLLTIRQTYLESKVDPNLDYPVDYYVYNKIYTKDYMQAWEITRALILETKSLAKEKNSKYLLVTATNNEQVNPDVWSELQKKYPKLSTQTDLEKPDRLLKEFCKNERLMCVFMLPAFKNYAKTHPDEKTHYKFDGHWNNTGTNLAAQILSEYILKNLDN